MASATPRRHEEILTHRNRRVTNNNGDADESFFDTTNDGDDKKQTRFFQSASSDGSPAQTPSEGMGFQTPRSQQRKRGKRKREHIQKNPFIVLFSIASVGLFCWIWHSNSSTLQPSSNRMMISVDTDTTRTQPSFQLHSHVGSASCSQDLNPDDVSFTLVTQVSADRLWMMEHQCHRWRASNSSNAQQYPISIAVYTNDTLTEIEDQLKDLGCDMDMVSLQVLSAKLYPFDDYPVNKLRNLALHAAKTTYAVLVDIDFWISQHLSQILQRDEVIDFLISDPLTALVIPAFQLQRQCHQWRECPEKNVPEMPLGLKDLKQQILDHKVTRFDPTNRGGHGSTRYKDWFKQNFPNGDTLLEIDCFLSNRYEPYLVFRLCAELPPFQDVFAGYGKNKMTWVMQLRRMGYSFWQLGKGAYVIHYPHLDSPSRMAWNNAPQKQQKQHDNPQKAVDWQAYKRGRMDQLFVQFREWLRLQVPDRTRVPFCQDKLDDDARLWYDRKAFNATFAAKHS